MIVGDAFAKPILRALDANPGKWDLSSMFMIASSGVMFSEESKQGLLGHIPTMMIVDAFSLVRGRRHGPVGVDGRRHVDDGEVHARREHAR